MGFIIMVVTIEMVFIIMDIVTLDMDTIMRMGIDTIMVDAIEPVMVCMDTIAAEGIMNVLMRIDQNVGVQTEVESMTEHENMFVTEQIM